MSKILELDSISPPDRVLKFKGVEYPLKVLSLKDFIALTRKTEEIQKKAKDNKEVSITDVIEMQIQAVQFAVPTMSRDVLESLTYEQLDAIINFAKDTAEQGKPEEKPAADASAEGKA